LIRETESWEMPHIAWWECKRDVGRANLKSFPYVRTTCKRFEQRVGARLPVTFAESMT